MSISDPPTAMAFIALLVSILSAIYTRRSWKEAKKANSITFYPHQKEIYDAFKAINAHMVQYGVSAKLEEVSKFYNSSENAHLYFDGHLAGLIKEFQNACFIVADKARCNPMSERDKISRDENYDLFLSLKLRIENLLDKALQESTKSG